MAATFVKPDLFSEPRRQFSSPQEWGEWLNTSLAPPELGPGAPLAIDLFAGCGGLALGFEAAGIETRGFEMKPEAVATYSLNLGGRCTEAMLTIGQPEGEADLVIGGPPCQPFSQIGYQRGMRDPRDGFPIFLDTVNRVRPKIAIIENVRGLLFRNKDYLRQVVAELERFGYSVDVRLLQALHYGVAQSRERVFVVASTVGWEWPEPVVHEPVTAGLALGDLAAEVTAESRFLTESMDRYVAAYEKASSCVNPRDLHLDRPARTVTCRNLGGATADMHRILLPDGRRRMLHIREGARLQSFPDWFQFTGSAYEQAEQIGNALPPLLGYAVAQQAYKFLEKPRVASTRRPAKAGPLVNDSPLRMKIEQAQTILSEAGVNMRKPTARGKERAVQGEISDRLSRLREMKKIPVRLPGGQELRLSPGPHNEIQRAIIEEFLPRFAHGASVLYVGDTENKSLVMDCEGLGSVGLPIPERGDRLPDIVAYEPERNWAFLVEAVHSGNPVDDERHAILMKLTTGCTAGRIFVTAFLTMDDFRKWVKRIAWETEVWIAESPDHMIHFNGDRFLGPYDLPEKS